MGIRWNFGVEASASKIDQEIKTIKNDLGDLGNQVLAIQGDVNSHTKKWNTFVEYSMIKRDKNWELQHFNNTGKTLDGRSIYEGVIEFEASGEANLVNNCNVLLNVLIYNISDNIFIEPSSIALRVHNNYQIRGTFPNDNKRYRLHFVGVLRTLKGDENVK